MVRPIKKRLIKHFPRVTYFKPRAVPLRALKEIELAADELEALRLCDLAGHSQEKAAREMGISQSTLQRILENARAKTAEGLVKGKAIKIIRK